jgi:hypothetical protein
LSFGDSSPIMSKEARSKGACWTCKLRRKKCDEEKPACSACTLLAIPCFGYYPPSWADGGEMQKAKAEELQIIIRELASLRRRGRRKHIFAQANGIKDGKTSHEQFPNSPLTKEVPKPKEEGLVRERVDGQTGQSFQDLILSSNLEKLKVNDSSHNQNRTVDFLKYDDQPNLLMYYFDVVFPSQFPVYNPTSSEGGRGWLLHIILRTKPLYHAALSMAAYHQRLQRREVVVSRTYETCAAATLQTHHYLAVNELRNHLDSFRQEERAQSLEGNTEVLGCIVFLILLEVSLSCLYHKLPLLSCSTDDRQNFLGDNQSWHIHLQAAQSLLFPSVEKGCPEPIRPGFPNESLSSIHKKAHQFFIGAIVWFDVLSSSTTGMKLWTPRRCLDKGFIDLEAMVGCEKSVIVAIMETTELKEWKATSQTVRKFSQAEFIACATRIESSLGEILEQCSGVRERAAILGSSAGKDQLTEPALVEGICRRSQISAVTRIFACAALVYLNVVVYGFHPDHPKIHENVSRAITAFKELRNQTVLGMLAWPLCIAGCMATDWQTDFFKEISLDQGMSDLKSWNWKRSFSIVEECWRLRKDGTNTPGWQQTMEALNMNILLI